MKLLKLIEENQSEALNPKPSKEKLSANDILVSRYIELDEAVKFLSKELEKIKSDFKHRGTFSTRNYVVAIKEVISERVCGKAHLIEALGMDLIKDKGLLSQSASKRVSVSKKEGAE